MNYFSEVNAGHFPPHTHFRTQNIKNIKRSISQMKSFLSSDQQLQRVQTKQDNQSLNSKKCDSHQHQVSRSSRNGTQQLIEQNCRLKSKLSKQKSLRRQLHNSLKKQQKMINSISTSLSFHPNRDRVSKISQKPLKQKRQKHYNHDETPKNHQPYNNTTKKPINNNKIGQRDQQVFSGRSIQLISHRQISGIAQKKSELDYHENLQMFSQISNKTRLYHQEYLEFLNCKLNQLIKQSGEEQNRSNKLKIRNQIGRIISEINKIRGEDYQKCSKQESEMMSVFSRKTVSHNQSIKQPKTVHRNIFQEFRP